MSLLIKILQRADEEELAMQNGEEHPAVGQSIAEQGVLPDLANWETRFLL